MKPKFIFLSAFAIGIVSIFAAHLFFACTMRAAIWIGVGICYILTSLGNLLFPNGRTREHILWEALTYAVAFVMVFAIFYGSGLVCEAFFLPKGNCFEATSFHGAIGLISCMIIAFALYCTAVYINSDTKEKKRTASYVINN